MFLFRWLRRLIFLALIFSGLYFFGDFNVRGVNVRDFLQTHATRANLEKAKDIYLQIYQAGWLLLESVGQNKDGAQTAQGAGAQNSLETLTKSLQNFSADDQKKLMEVLQKNANSR